MSDITRWCALFSLEALVDGAPGNELALMTGAFALQRNRRVQLETLQLVLRHIPFDIKENK